MIKLNLCQNKCCPTVAFEKGKFVIRDDFGGNVVLTPEQLSVLVKKYPALRREMKLPDTAQ